jgi:hypothetical protein
MSTMHARAVPALAEPQMDTLKPLLTTPEPFATAEGV